MVRNRCHLTPPPPKKWAADLYLQAIFYINFVTKGSVIKHFKFIEQFDTRKQRCKC